MDKVYLREGQEFCFKGNVVTIEKMWADNVLLLCDRGQQFVKKIDELHMSFINEEIASTRNFKEVFYKGPTKNVKISPLLSDKEKAIIERNKAYVEDAMHVPHGPLLDRQIKVTHSRIKDELPPPCRTTVWRWKTLFIESNNDPTSLLPRSGYKGKWKRFNEEEEKVCLEFIHTFYLSPERPTVTRTLDAINAHIIKLNETRIYSDRLKQISRSIFQRLLNENFIAYEIDLKRKGEKYARHHYKGVINPPKRYDDAFEMGAMDHTVLDVMVLGQNGRVMCRPYITILINSATKCIMGFYIGFTPPSDCSVSKCFKHALLPKTNLKLHHPEIKNEWLSFGPLRSIKLDNSFEFHSNTMERIANQTNTVLVFCPRGAPWFKAEIERYLKTQNILIHNFPGTTFSNTVEKGEYDSEKEAYITLEDLKRLITRWIVDVYHQKPHEGLYGRTPNQMWRLMVDQQNIPLITELGDIDYLLAKATSRMVDHRGVSIEGIWYGSSDLINLRKECGEKFKTTVRYSEEDLGRIWVIHPRNNDFYIEVPAIDREYAENLSMYAHKVNRKRAYKQRYPDSVVGYKLAQAEINERIKKENKKLNSKVGRYLEKPQQTINQSGSAPNTYENYRFAQPETWAIHDFDLTIEESRL